MPLKCIFEKSLEEHKVPEIRLSAHVYAIFKSVRNRGLRENYKPVSLTSVTGKVLERIIRDDIVNYMTGNNFLTKSHHGFLAGKSCVIQLLEFLDDVRLDQQTPDRSRLLFQQILELSLSRH